MALSPAQTAAVQAFRGHLADATSTEVRQRAFEQVVETIKQQQEDQLIRDTKLVVDAVQADPTYSDLLTILWAELNQRL